MSYKVITTLNVNGSAWYLSLWLILLFGSCKKDVVKFEFTELNSGIKNDLNSITFENDSIGYACGGIRYDHGDILKTTDGGKTWNSQDENLIKALYKINVASHDTIFSCGMDGKIFRTRDGGNTWDLFQSYLYRPIRDIFMVDSKTGYCCGGEGYKIGYIYHTTNGGDLWIIDTFSIEFRAIFFLNENTGYAAGYGAIFKTVDGAATWQITPATGDFFFSLYFTNDETGYAVGYEGSIIRTIDGGNSWERIRNGNELIQGTWHLNQVIFRDSQIGYIIGEDGCFFKTTDAGMHWMRVENAPDVDWKGIALVSNGGYLCGAGGKIYRFVE